jgi:hypothetical protein
LSLEFQEHNISDFRRSCMENKSPSYYAIAHNPFYALYLQMGSTFPSWQDYLFLHSKSEGAGGLDQMSYRIDT